MSTAAEDFPSQYYKKEKEETKEQVEERNALVAAVVESYSEVDYARLKVGYSSFTAFCKLVITEKDLEENVPPALRTGLLEKAGTYDGVVRLNVSTNSAVRMTIRINVPNDVGGPLLEEAQPSAYPDKYKQVDILVAEELKEFIAASCQDLTDILSLRHEPSFKDIFRAILNLPGVIGVAKGMKHAKGSVRQDRGIVGKNYYAGLPFRAGASGAMKWAMLPQQEHILSQDEKLDDPEDANASAKSLFNSMKKWMQEHKDGAKWDFKIQIADNGENGQNSNDFDIETGSAQWDESKNPYVTVGTFIIPADQEFSADTKLNKFFNPQDDEKTSKPEFYTLLFSPWINCKLTSLWDPSSVPAIIYTRHVARSVGRMAMGRRNPRFVPFWK